MRQMADNNYVHAGHRQRVRDKVDNGYVESLADHEVLEFLLFPVVPRVDTNKIAHDLIKAFGSVKQVLMQDSMSLQTVEGVGERIASYIVATNELFKRAVRGDNRISKLDTPDKTISYINSLFALEREERLYAICLDGNFKILSTILLGKGNTESISLNFSEVCRKIVLSKAKMVLLTHNHPDSAVIPSIADGITTERLIQSLWFSGVMVIDHIISNGTETFSFKSSGAMDTLYRKFGDEGYQKFSKVGFDFLPVSSNEQKFNIASYMQLLTKR